MSEETDDRNTSIIVTDCNCIVYSISLIIILELFELPMRNDFKRLPSSFIVIGPIQIIFISTPRVTERGGAGVAAGL
jgi:hypothetical protein